MSRNRYNPLSVFNMPDRSQTIPSVAPNVGPAQQGPDKLSVKERNSVTPKTGAVDDTGYGGSADPSFLRTLGAARSQAQHAEHMARQKAMQTPVPPMPAAMFNDYYDEYLTHSGWDMLIRATAHGTWVVGTTVSQAVTLDKAPNLRLGMYPGAVIAYPVLLVFTYAPSVTTATGEFSWIWTPKGTDLDIPLGEYTAAQSVYNDKPHIIPVSINDPQQQDMGTLTVTSNTVVGTPSLFWRMMFGFAYKAVAANMRRAESEQPLREVSGLANVFERRSI